MDFKLVAYYEDPDEEGGETLEEEARILVGPTSESYNFPDPVAGGGDKLHNVPC